MVSSSVNNSLSLLSKLTGDIEGTLEKISTREKLINTQYEHLVCVLIISSHFIINLFVAFSCENINQHRRYSWRIPKSTNKAAKMLQI